MLWLFEKYKNYIEHTEMSANSFRLEIVPKQTNFEFSKENEFNCLFNWDKVNPHYSFFYDYEDSEQDIRNKLNDSDLLLSDYLFVETTSEDNIIKVPTLHFIKHWDDYICSNQGMGAIVTSVDYKLCMEFTDDYKYYLFSNFKI